MTVEIVADSACDLPDDARPGITIVPLLVAFGEESYRDRADLSPERFWELLAERDDFPTTASPGPGAFARAYRDAAERGAEAVVSVHVSAEVSRVVASARTAAAEAPVPVEVVDSRSVSLGEGLVVLAARDAASAAGSSPAGVARVARDAAERVAVVALLDQVDHLRRGGRLGRARAALSDLLRIRPVLTLERGEPALVSRARTRRRGIAEMLDLVSGPAERAAVLHSDAPEVDEVVAAVGRTAGVRPLVARIGAVTGTHLGPGAVGVAVLPGSHQLPDAGN